MRLYPEKYAWSIKIHVGIQVTITPTPMCSYYCISKESVTEAWLVYSVAGEAQKQTNSTAR